MDKLIGDNGCTYSDVCTWLSQGSTVGILYRRWKSLASELRLSKGHVESIQQRIEMEKIDSYQVILDLLESWRSSAANGATILNLKLALEKLEWRDLAVHLQSGFKPSAQSINLQNPRQALRHIKLIGEITYDTRKKLGEGNNTFVYQGKYNGKDVAVKVILADIDTLEFEKKIKEIDMLKTNKGHINIVKLLKHETDERCIYIATELCDETLENWLKRTEENRKNGDKLILPLVLDILQQTLCGLAHISKNWIVHRDLKPENILLVHICQHQIRVKIADFGISRLLGENNTSVSVRTHSGTRDWKAPEMHKLTTFENSDRLVKCSKTKKQSTATDIFSLGCIFYYALTGRKHPFGQDSDTRTYNIKRYKSQIDSNHFSPLSMGNVKLLERMISKEPKDRPTINQIIRHPMFWSKRKTLDYIVCVAHVFDSSKFEEVNSCIQEVESKYREATADCLPPEGWLARICSDVKNYLNSSRAYDGCKIQDLVIAMRDLIFKYGILPKNVSDVLGTLDGAFLDYWIIRFPYLLETIWLSWQQLKCVTELNIRTEFFEYNEET